MVLFRICFLSFLIIALFPSDILVRFNSMTHSVQKMYKNTLKILVANAASFLTSVGRFCERCRVNENDFGCSKSLKECVFSHFLILSN